jgi:hypothetical protein
MLARVVHMAATAEFQCCLRRRVVHFSRSQSAPAVGNPPGWSLEVRVMSLLVPARRVMRSIFGLLGCVSVSAAPLSLADPPAAEQSAAPTVITAPVDTAPASATPTTTAPTTTTATVAPTAPSAPSVSQTAGAAPAAAIARDHIERRLLAKGYKLEMRHGEKYFCRITDTLGSRVTPVKACSLAEQLIAKEQEGKEFTEWAQRTSTMCPSGCK